jgi:polysaccharide biosynthesis protein PslG
MLGIQDGWLREVQKLGLSWFKQQIRWEDFEKEQGNIDWGVLDVVMTSAQHFQLKVMLSIVTAPPWAREAGVDLEKHGPPADNADYVNFVSQIMEKYPGQIHAIEVWNEMNIDREWTSTGGLSAANYVSLLKDTYTAVKAIDPGVIVISGALSPTGFNDGVGAWDDFVYLDQLIAAGMLNYVDCVGAHANGYNIGPDHPYDQVPNDPNAKFRGPFDNPHHSWSFYSTIRSYAAAVARAGGNQKICVTEFGWASTEDLDGFPPGFEFANDNTLEEQKTFTIQALDLMKEWDVVWLAFIWNLNYGPQAGWATDNDNVPYSIIGKDYAFRPVYDAIIEWSKEQGS